MKFKKLSKNEIIRRDKILSKLSVMIAKALLKCKGL